MTSASQTASEDHPESLGRLARLRRPFHREKVEQEVQLNVRIPVALHRQLRVKTVTEGTTLEKFVTDALWRALEHAQTSDAP